jgi:hypothetical protein
VEYRPVCPRQLLAHSFEKQLEIAKRKKKMIRLAKWLINHVKKTEFPIFSTPKPKNQRRIE